MVAAILTQIDHVRLPCGYWTCENRTVRKGVTLSTCLFFEVGSPKLVKWFGIFGVGLAATVAGIEMAFLSDHHWLVTYEHSLWCERYADWFILIGVVLVLVGCIGLSFKIRGKAAIYMGMGLIVLSLGPPWLLEPPTGLINVHSWTFAFLLPMFVGSCGSVVLIVAGSLRLILQRHRRLRAAPDENN
jgi:hypothetical protein